MTVWVGTENGSSPHANVLLSLSVLPASGSVSSVPSCCGEGGFASQFHLRGSHFVIGRIAFS